MKDHLERIKIEITSVRALSDGNKTRVNINTNSPVTITSANFTYNYLDVLLTKPFIVGNFSCSVAQQCISDPFHVFRSMLVNISVN